MRNKLTSWANVLPWIRPYYAVKSNPIDVLLKELAQGGAGFDCASRTEIASALRHGMKS